MDEVKRELEIRDEDLIWRVDKVEKKVIGGLFANVVLECMRLGDGRAKPFEMALEYRRQKLGYNKKDISPSHMENFRKNLSYLRRSLRYATGFDWMIKDGDFYYLHNGVLARYKDQGEIKISFNTSKLQTTL